jgi:hypothetical protein
MFAGETSSVRWRSLGRDAERNSETLASRETRSPTFTESRMVDEDEKTMIPVETDSSLVFSPASQNPDGPLKGVSSERGCESEIQYLCGDQTGDVGESLPVVSGEESRALDTSNRNNIGGGYQGERWGRGED